MIEAVIFDWGGVIQRTVDHGPRRRLSKELGLSLPQRDGVDS